MSKKYDSINPFDESVREYFNLLDDMVGKVGLQTQIAPNSDDSLLQILMEGNCICTVDGQSGSTLYNPYPEIIALRQEFINARIRIPFVSDMELEEMRLKALAELERDESEEEDLSMGDQTM